MAVRSRAWLDVFAMSMLNYVRLIAYDRTTQVEVEPCEDNANTDCKSAKYIAPCSEIPVTPSMDGDNQV